MTAWFYFIFITLILAELIKGLSANGTPPVLQKFSWQLDLARFMWTRIRMIRIALFLLLVAIVVMMSAGERVSIIAGAAVLGMLWALVYWVFNRFWVGKYKFLPLTNKRFVESADNTLDPATQVVGVDYIGVQKAYPVSMMFYHHQIPDEIGGHPIWVTYCGLCRAGRVYDLMVDGQPLTFSLVGAISFNAVFEDTNTGSWWRQETGEAVKGPLSGKALEDIPFEQMTLENWLARHPESQVLQYDPDFQRRYQFITKLMNHEASLPGWHRQETPPLIIGVDSETGARGYDWNSLKKAKMVNDQLGSTPLLIMASDDGSSAFAYNRNVAGNSLEFKMGDDGLQDVQTQSRWDQFGRCISGDMKGTQLEKVQSYQQFLRAWVTFHPETDFYVFGDPG
jgi:hypothetical protein